MAEWKFLLNFVDEKGRKERLEISGKPAKSFWKKKRSRETRKEIRKVKTLAGAPQMKSVRREGPREPREEKRQRKSPAGGPQKGLLTFHARGSPARGFG